MENKETKKVTKTASKKKTSVKKASKKTTKKVTEKPITKAAKKTEKKPATKKTEKKSVKKVTKKADTKAVKKIAKKPVRKVTKSTVTKKKEIIEIPVEHILEEPINNKESVQTNNNIKFKVVLIVNIVLFILLIVGIYALFEKNDNETSQSNNVEEYIASSVDDTISKVYQDEWYENHNKAYVQDDYVGQIVFGNGAIDEPVLQGENNETYLNRDFETFEYRICGPSFLDYECEKRGSQNTVIYGHTRSTAVDPEHVMMFSPLHILTEEEYYDDNKLIYLVYEDSVDVFLVTNVYSVKVETDENGTQYLADGEPEYYLSKYTSKQFKEYKNAVIERQYYDTGFTFDENDSLLTLQTCFEGSNDKFIVLAKKIDTKQYQD